MAHEVLPTYSDRHAIALRLYDKTERMKAIERARDTGSSTEAAKSSSKACKRRLGSSSQFSSHGQQGPSGLGHENNAMRIDLPVTPEELVSIRRRVRALSIDAPKIVSSITGAPSETSFRE